jgi:hypothetical protein
MLEYTLLSSQSAATDITSVPLAINDLRYFSIEVTFTGSDVVGTLTLEASNGGSTWVTVTDSSQAVTASTDHMYDVRDAGYRYVRLVWDYTSGAGNISAIAYVKQNQ